MHTCIFVKVTHVSYLTVPFPATHALDISRGLRPEEHRRSCPCGLTNTVSAETGKRRVGGEASGDELSQVGGGKQGKQQVWAEEEAPPQQALGAGRWQRQVRGGAARRD